MRAIKHVICFLIVIVFVTGAVDAQSNNPGGQTNFDFSRFDNLPTFRSIPWGASKDYVLRNDDSQRIETGQDFLRLRNKLGDLEVDITYFFWRGHHIKGTYLTTQNLGEYSNYIERYNWLKSLLSQKYGSPKIDLMNWADHSFKNQPNRWLTAVSRGHLEHFAFWEEEDIVISIRLGAVNQRPSILVEYFIKNFDAEMDQTDDAEVLRKL